MKDKFIKLYLEIAKVMSTASYATRLKVGAVAVKDHRILATSYNGTPPNTDNTCEETYLDIEYIPTESGDMYLKSFKQRTKKEVIHAEMNLIYKLARDGESGSGADLFITHAPCFECAKAILSVGFKKVWFRNQYRSEEGIQLLKNNGIDVEKVD